MGILGKAKTKEVNEPPKIAGAEQISQPMPILKQAEEEDEFIIQEPPKMQELPKFNDIDYTQIIKKIEKLENGYQVFNDFKERLGNLVDSDTKNKNHIKDIEDIEENLEVVFNEIRDILKIEVQGIPIKEGFEQVCDWLRDSPVPNYCKAAGNGYHYMEAIIKATEDLKLKEESLKLLIDQFKSKLNA